MAARADVPLTPRVRPPRALLVTLRPVPAAVKEPAPCTVTAPEKVLAPAKVWVVVLTTPPKLALAELRLSTPPVRVAPLALALPAESMAAKLRAVPQLARVWRQRVSVALASVGIVMVVVFAWAVEAVKTNEPLAWLLATVSWPVVVPTTPKMAAPD